MRKNDFKGLWLITVILMFSDAWHFITKHWIGILNILAWGVMLPFLTKSLFHLGWWFIFWFYIVTVVFLFLFAVLKLMSVSSAIEEREEEMAMLKKALKDEKL